MKGRPSTFWGKLEQDDAKLVTGWHPLPAHCADVAACTEALLQQTLLRRRLATLAGRDDLDEVDVARLSALAALHDIGKFNLGFQRKGDVEPRDTAGHVSEALALFQTDYAVKEQLFQALPVADLESWCGGDGAFELLTAAVGHHGRPVRWGEMSAQPSLWRVERGLDPFAGIAALAASARAWFPAAFAPSSSHLPDAPAFQHGFAGLVMLADWLGSDRAFFPFADDQHDRMPFARVRAGEAVRAIGLDARAARATMGEGLPGFDRVSPHPPYEAQVKTMALGRPPEGGLTILESETGSGKTEAALGRFVQLFHAGLVDGMVFALPTRTAATQLHTRVVQAMKLAFPDDASRPAVVLAVPGYLQVDDDRGRRLPEFNVLWNDDDKERARHRGWAAETPKRYLAGAVAVGTIDQVLLSSLRVGHAHLRATALLRQLLVVDEVHASDAYMNRILEEVLRFHLAAGGHAFLMSATLGTHVRRRLERAALGTRAGSDQERSLAAALATPYPVVHHAARGATPTMDEVHTPGLPKTVHVTLASIADDAATVAARALQAARSGARVLVLRNTVTDAVATQLALEALATPADAALLFRVGGIVTLHHARFAKSDRERLDQAIEDRFGKNAPPHGGVITVATQTVQQSLDLDADILFTDLAPMDVLLQRFGRVHRHPKRNAIRPAGFEDARAVVLISDTPLEDNIREKTGEAWGKHGAGTVYEDLVILEATRRRLAESGTLVIPTENRALVERTTHPEALDEVVRSLGEVWQKHQIKVSGKRLAATGIADLNVVDRAAHFGDYSFKRTDLQDRIASRLGESDRRAVFPEPPVGPFGGKVRELTLPGWLTRTAPADPDLAPTDVQVGEGPSGATVRFAFGPLRFAYDRLGLRRDGLPSHDPTEDTADA
jgi:CRISPR-associated endonuclease/helicase Cas3